jgi:hypothetical protein
MAKIPKIPMTHNEVPLQRQHLVVDLPPRPVIFQGSCDFIDPMPEKDRPKGSPRNIKYLGSVEWAWSPVNSRFDSYYLNPRGRYWLLWVRWQNEDEWNHPWEWTLYAYGPRKGVDLKTAATYLLLDAWKAEKENSDLDHYFLIDEPGLLSIEDISEIARNVWPDHLRSTEVRNGS